MVDLTNFFRKKLIPYLVNLRNFYKKKIPYKLKSKIKFDQVTPLVPIIRNSGGVISNWHGENVLSSGNIVVSSNKRLHSIIVSILKKIL